MLQIVSDPHDGRIGQQGHDEGHGEGQPKREPDPRLPLSKIHERRYPADVPLTEPYSLTRSRCHRKLCARPKVFRK